MKRVGLIGCGAIGRPVARALSEVEAIRKQLGDKVVVQDTPATGIFGIAVNQRIKPFNDERVRKALTLGLDRYTASRVLYPIASLKDVGGLMRPGTPWALSDAELQKFPGFGKDMDRTGPPGRRAPPCAAPPGGGSDSRDCRGPSARRNTG
jgi:hypothetical protein